MSRQDAQPPTEAGKASAVWAEVLRAVRRGETVRIVDPKGDAEEDPRS